MKKIIFLLCYLLLFYCCKRTDKNNIILLSDTNSNIVYDSICSLKENIDILGNINSFNFIDSNHFIISTISPDPSLFIYNSQGIQEIVSVEGQVNILNRQLYIYLIIIFIYGAVNN